MLDKICLPSDDEVGRLIVYSECQSRIQPLTSRMGAGPHQSHSLNTSIS
jgi:hypothetical protein